MMCEKITVVAGDISRENFGIKDSKLLLEMLNGVEVVIHLAANTNFDERYDVSIGANTLGAKNVVDFSKACTNLKVLVHVSTAYVCGEGKGLVSENPFKMGETLNGESSLDIEFEKKLADERLEQLIDDDCSEQYIKSQMSDLGIKRAKKYGWPNTYVFTKAMGEMLVGELKGDLPIVILRPTMVTSTYMEPFPGWAEGFRTIDSMAIGFGTGKVKCLLANPQTIADLIPVDMVINAMIVAMIATTNRTNEEIYHTGSSVSNPIEVGKVCDMIYSYFKTNRWVDKHGRPIIVSPIKVFSSINSFHRFMAINYTLPLKGFEIFNTICLDRFGELYRDMSRKLNFISKLMQTYQPYLLFEALLDDTNIKKLKIATQKSIEEKDLFCFDPTTLNWEDYFWNAYFPGLVMYVMR